MAPLLRWALVALFTISLAAPATTAPAAPEAQPAVWESVDVALHAETEGAILIVSGTLPESTPLPAQVELAVPEGMKPMWAGEILGGPVAEDPEVTYVKDTREGMDVYAFTLTKSRIAQIEASAPQALAFDGTSYAASIDWTAPWDIPAVSVAARIPQGAQILSPAEGANVAPGPSGYSYYSTSLKDVAAGEPASLAFSYSVPAAGASGTSAGAAPAGDGGVGAAIVTLVMLGALALIGFGFWRKMQHRGLEDDAVESSGTSAAAKDGAAPAAGKRGGNRQSRPDPATAAASAPRGPKKSTLLAVAIAFALVVGVIIATNSGGSANVVGDTVMMTYASVDECAVATIPLSPPPGASLADDAEEILEALRSLEGVGKAAINLSTSVISVDYCQSYADEAKIRLLLAPTGYVDQAAAAPPAAGVETTSTP